MTRQHDDEREPAGDAARGSGPHRESIVPGININADEISGGQFSLGGHGNVFNQGLEPAVPQAPGAADRRNQETGHSPVHTLYAFGDIVGYSRLTARLQKLSQDDLVSVLDAGLAETGVQPELVTAQDQGDARLLRFPVGTDAAKVLAVMPRRLNDELLARNQDMAPHARMRVRLSFTMGAALQGGTGLAGAAPIAVVRLANSAVFRSAMNAAPRAQCGVIIDDHLHGEYVRQGFRADINPGEYLRVSVSDPGKGFEAVAWMKLFGYSPQQVTSLLGQGAAPDRGR